jgi:hypothetical protein
VTDTEKKDTRSHSQRLASAYHEAGHAVVAVLKNVMGDHVTLGQDAHEEETLLYRPASVEELRTMCGRRALSMAAGREALCKAAYKGLLGVAEHRRVVSMIEAALSGHHDEDAVRRDLEALSLPADRDAVRKTFEDAALEVDELLTAPDVWSAVEAVKDGLLAKATLTKGEVVEILRSCGVARGPESVD